MISYQEALNIISNAVPGAPVLEDIVTGMAQGRVLAEEVISHVDNPPFRAAAMDGFALVAAETQSASPESPLAFPVAGCIAAGDGCGSVGESNYSSGRAFEIMTGAVVPAWCDCVVRVEDVSLVSGQPDETRTVVIKRPVFRGENVRSRGEDFCSGQPILRAGVVLLPHHLMLCQAGGVKMVRVQRKPRVGVLTTGKELIDGRTSKEEPLPEGKIFNSCGIFLRSALTMLGAAHADYGSVPDDPKECTDRISQMLSDGMDVIITSGAVSQGRYDFMPHVWKKVGGEILFHKVAVRPGKPVMFGRFRRSTGAAALFFGLPGNPLAVVCGMRFFVEPYLRHLSGFPAEQGFSAELACEVKKPAEVMRFCLGTLQGVALELRFCPVERQQSFMLSALASASAWALLPAGRAQLSAGELVECRTLYSSAWLSGSNWGQL